MSPEQPPPSDSGLQGLGRLMTTHKTKTALVVETLRQAILNGDIGPGERFDVRKVAQQLNVSITPVREALRILQADGLVNYDEHRAISAIELSPNDAAEVYALRALIEGFATQGAAERIDATVAKLLQELHAEMEKAVKAGDQQAALIANRRWHFAIYTASGYSLTISFINRLWATYEWNSIWKVPGRLGQSLSEHRAITKELIAGRGVEAAALMAQHVRGGEQAVLSYKHLGGQEQT